jgi:hypothetical protein
MKVLMIGANGYMGPHVVRRLAPQHRLRITDIHPAPEEIRQAFPDQEYFDLDVTDEQKVRQAAEGMDAIINLSVVRQHPTLAFRVNAQGCYHVMQAAVEHGIRRVINTGPHFTVAGPSYEGFDFGLHPDAPPQPGTGLYPLTKSLGQDICRMFADQHEVYVQDLLFYILRDLDELRPEARGRPFVVSWRDAAEAFRLSLEIDLQRLPSRFEVFFILGDIPHAKFSNDKAKRILGFQPQDDVAVLWRRRDRETN